MSKWYLDKSHSWRDHLDASTVRSSAFSLKLTSSSSHQSRWCRWQHPGSCWCHSQAASLLWPYSQPSSAKPPYSTELKVPKSLPPFTPAMQESLSCSLLTNDDWRICSGSRKVLSIVSFSCMLSKMHIHDGHPPLDHQFFGDRTLFLAVSTKYLSLLRLQTSFSLHLLCLAVICNVNIMYIYTYTLLALAA